MPRPVDIYGGRDPREVPFYFLSEAAHYLRLPTATVRSWAVGRDYPTGRGTRTFLPLIKVADPKGRRLSFHNLVELHVLSAIRRGHRLRLKAVRRASRYLAERFGSEHPLIEHEMLTDGKDLFIQQYGKLLSISQQGQQLMRQVLEVYLKRIKRDPAGLPIQLFPFTRRGGQLELMADSRRTVSINPAIRFGRPCIAGTGIPTAVIAERYEAGDSIHFLAADYERPREEIEEAIRYEVRLAA